MKKIKKILAVLLTAALVFMLPVSAGAYDMPEEAYVSGYFDDDLNPSDEDSGRYVMCIGDFGLDEACALLDYYGVFYTDRWETLTQCKFKNGIKIVFISDCDSHVVTVYDANDNELGVAKSELIDGEWFFTDDYNYGMERVGRYAEEDDNSSSFYGLILRRNSPLLETLAASDEVELRLTTILDGEENAPDFSGSFGVNPDGTIYVKDVPWNTIKTDFMHLEEYGTTDTPDEETGDTPVVSDPDDDTIVGGDTDPNVPTEDTTSGDEITGDTSDEQPASGADEGDDTTSDIPADDVTGNDDTASDSADEEANADDNAGSIDGADDNNKTSADTGAVGVAAAAALAVTAIGAGVLSRRKK